MVVGVFFNLLINATFSLLAGLFVVWLAFWIFHIPTSRWKLYLLSLPFAKMLYDLALRVPAKSILFSGVDIYSLPKRSQDLIVGAGFSKWGPNFNVIYRVHGPNGDIYSASVADYLFLALKHTFGIGVPIFLLCVLVLGSLFFLSRRLILGFQFERLRAQQRQADQLLRVQACGLRRVEIYISTAFSGTPFTGGVLRPYICIPKDAMALLSPQELEAVISHEMAHIKHFDLLFTATILFLGDIFWFVPGYRILSRKIDRMREVLADRVAIALGARAESLASAILKLKEIPDRKSRFILYSAFFREKSLLKERVLWLLNGGNDVKARLGWDRIWVRAIATAWISYAVVVTKFMGNHDIGIGPAPFWLEDLAQRISSLGIFHR